MATKQKPESAFATLMWFDWVYRRALWDQANAIAHGKLAQVGTPRLVVWAYVLSFIGYISLFVRSSVVVGGMAVTGQIGTLDYFDLTMYIAIFAVLPIMLWTLWIVGRRTWEITTSRVTGVMLLSTLACIAAAGVPVVLYATDTLPTYCSSYMQATPASGEQFQPSQQLTDPADCVARTIQPLNKSLERRCASYMDETAPNTYSVRFAVCQTGATPPPRSASTPVQ